MKQVGYEIGGSCEGLSPDMWGEPNWEAVQQRLEQATKDGSIALDCAVLCIPVEE